MKTLLTVTMALVLLTGCATSFYVPPTGDATSYKSMQECRLAHAGDVDRCVDRGQYVQASQNTIFLILHGISVALQAALTIFTLGR
jgi:hypothetical protein